MSRSINLRCILDVTLHPWKCIGLDIHISVETHGDFHVVLLRTIDFLIDYRSESAAYRKNLSYTMEVE